MNLRTSLESQLQRYSPDNLHFYRRHCCYNALVLPNNQHRASFYHKHMRLYLSHHFSPYGQGRRAFKPTSKANAYEIENRKLRKILKMRRSEGQQRLREHSAKQKCVFSDTFVPNITDRLSNT